MKKLKLDVDALKVEEFATTGGELKGQGTVRGHVRSFPDWNCPYTWNGFGCQSVSGQVACICQSESPETCDINCA